MNVDVFKCKLVRETSLPYDGRVNTPHAIASIAEKLIGDSPDEQFIAFALDAGGKLAGVHMVACGAPSACLVDMRSVFRPCILNNAASVVVAHNHPSGDCTPSAKDIDTTHKLVECGKILDLTVVDHIIVGFGGGYTSLHERGIL